MEIKKAQKTKLKIKIGLVGCSGSGKTMSALKMARGITTFDKVCVIDSENSADLYSDLGEYSVIHLDMFSPEKYIEAIEIAEKAGMEVIIIDSITHEWENLLDFHANMVGNSFTNWGKITPRHNKFIDKILQSNAHVICTIRTKQDYILNEVNGKQVPQKVGLKAVSRDGIDYEFTLVFDINLKHNAIASKDRTNIFMDKPEFIINEETGKTIKEWTEKGVDRVDVVKVDNNSSNVAKTTPQTTSTPVKEETKVVAPKCEKCGKTKAPSQYGGYWCPECYKLIKK